MKNLNVNQVKRATKIHGLSLVQAQKAAIACGWDESLVKEVANLDWTIKGIERLGKESKAKKRNIQILLDVRDAAKMGFCGMFALSQLS